MDTELLLGHEKAEHILREGWQLFQQKGFRGASIDELCMRCGLTKPTLYYYFGDKENLFVQVLHYRLNGFHEVIDQPGPLAERLQRVATKILEYFQVEYNALLRDRTHIKNPENLQRIRAIFHGELFGPLVKCMQAGIDHGELGADNPGILTLVFMGIINNFIGRAGNFKMDNSTLARHLVEHFLNGVKKK